MLEIIAESSFHLKEFKHVILLQEHARKALDVLWERRQRGSDLVGTVINIHNGEWVRRGEAVQTQRYTNIDSTGIMQLLTQAAEIEPY